MDFFLFQTSLHVDDVSVLSCPYTYIFPLRTQTVRLIGLKCGPPRVEPLLQAMVGRCITLSDKQSRPIAPPAPINKFFYSEILFK